MNSMEPPVSAEMSQIANNLASINKEKKPIISEYLFTKSQFGTEHSYKCWPNLYLKLKYFIHNQTND